MSLWMKERWYCWVRSLPKRLWRETTACPYSCRHWTGAWNTLCSDWRSRKTNRSVDIVSISGCLNRQSNLAGERCISRISPTIGRTATSSNRPGQSRSLVVVGCNWWSKVWGRIRLKRHNGSLHLRYIVPFTHNSDDAAVLKVGIEVKREQDMRGILLDAFENRTGKESCSVAFIS